MASAECSEETEKCIRLVFKAVRQNSVAKLRLAKYTYSQNQLLTSLVQCNKKGETPLVIAMKGKNVPVIRKLVTVLQKCDYITYKFHLMFVIEQLYHHIPIIELIYYIKDTYNDCWFKFVAKVFIKSTSVTRQDKAVALELIGAYTIMTIQSQLKTKLSMCGLECWRKAMALRYFPQDGELPLPKMPDLSVPSVATSLVFGSAVEVTTMEELSLLQEDFERNSLLIGRDAQLPCVKRMKIQALLVIRRISSQNSHAHFRCLYLESLFSFTEFILFMNESKILINSFLVILEQLNGFDPKLIPFQLFEIFIKTLCLVARHFVETLREPHDSSAREELTYANLLLSTELITKFFPEPATISSIEIMGQSFASIVYSFLFVLYSISPQLTNQEKQKLEDYYSSFIRNLFTERTTSVLHVALSYCSFCYDEVLYLNILKLILQLGADPNAIDKDGLTPLHFLAQKHFFLMDEYVPIFQTLLDAGGHLDMATDDGQTVISIFKKNVIERQKFDLVVHPYFESLINTVFPLSCYAARVIRRNGIRFDEDRLPSHLQEFVKRHSAKDFTDCDYLQNFGHDLNDF